MADTPKKTGYGIVPKFVWLDYGTVIGPVGVALYAMLAGYTGSKRDCWPSVKKMAEKIGIDERTARKYMGILRDTGLVAIKLQPGRNSLYKLATSTLEVGTLDVGTLGVGTSSVPTSGDTQCTHTPPTQCTHNKNNNKNHIKDTQTVGGLFGDSPEEPKPGNGKPAKAKRKVVEHVYPEWFERDIWPAWLKVHRDGDKVQSLEYAEAWVDAVGLERLKRAQEYYISVECAGRDRDKIKLSTSFLNSDKEFVRQALVQIDGGGVSIYDDNLRDAPMPYNPKEDQ